MKMTNRIYDIYLKIIVILFFLVFTIPILSPSVYGKTVYLYFIIPFLDLRYVKNTIISILKSSNKKIVYSILFFLFTTIILGKFSLTIECIGIINTLLYLLYTKKNNTFKYFYPLIYFNIMIAIFQFVFMFINPSISIAIGPTNISKIIWGEYATATYTNFYSIFVLPRVSGWSREAGFFASLVLISFIVYLKDDNERKTVLKTLLFIIGFMISFSKVSIIILILFFILKFYKYINKIPYLIGVPLFILIGIWVSDTIFFQFYNNPRWESITHRLSGYSVMKSLSFKEFLLGSPSISTLEFGNQFEFLSIIEKLNEFTGLPNLIIHYGIVIFIAYLILLILTKVPFGGFIFITFVTFTTTYFTSQSFVILGYYYIYQYGLYDKQKGGITFSFIKNFFNNVILKIKSLTIS